MSHISLLKSKDLHISTNVILLRYLWRMFVALIFVHNSRWISLPLDTHGCVRPLQGYGQAQILCNYLYANFLCCPAGHHGLVSFYVEKSCEHFGPPVFSFVRCTLCSCVQRRSHHLVLPTSWDSEITVLYTIATHEGTFKLRAGAVRIRSSLYLSTEDGLHIRRDNIGLIIVVANFSSYTMGEGRKSDVQSEESEHMRSSTKKEAAINGEATLMKETSTLSHTRNLLLFPFYSLFTSIFVVEHTKRVVQK